MIEDLIQIAVPLLCGMVLGAILTERRLRHLYEAREELLPYRVPAGTTVEHNGPVPRTLRLEVGEVDLGGMDHGGRAEHLRGMGL